MGTEYTPIFLFLIVAILVGASMIILSASPFLNPKKTTRVKQMPYESGMDPIDDARQRFDVRFYLVAIVFLLFDVELLFLYPWVVAQWSLSDPAVAAAATAAPSVAQSGSAGIPAVFRGLVFYEILVFVAVLAAAYAYAWKK